MTFLRRVYLFFAIFFCPTDAVNANEVLKMTASNSTQLQEVFFGGQPWVVLCTFGGQISGTTQDWEQFKLLKKRMPSVGAGLLDCDARLPSGKTAIARFKLTRKISPMLLLCANGKRPVQLRAQEFSDVSTSKKSKKGQKDKSKAAKTPLSVGTLVKNVRRLSKAGVYVINQDVTFRTRCLKQRMCALVIHSDKLSSSNQNVLQTLIQKHRNVSFVTLDHNEFVLQPDMYPSPSPRLAKPVLYEHGRPSRICVHV
jgi:hypothetical protein